MLKLAIQKSGRLSEDSFDLLSKCGIKLSSGDRKLLATSANFPIEVLFLRDDDIPQYVEQGVADAGIVGQNVLLEKGKQISVVQALGFAACKMSIAVKKDEAFTDIKWLEGKRIATSYPLILKDYLQQMGINAEIEEIGGSVEVAPGIGLADAIFDIVGTGSTLVINGLKEVHTVLRSEAVLVKSNKITPEAQELLNKLVFRIHSVLQAKDHKYILMNVPNHCIEEISALLPGMKSPTVTPLATEGWSSIQTVITEKDFWDKIHKLKALGAEGILVTPIEKLIA